MASTSHVVPLSPHRNKALRLYRTTMTCSAHQACDKYFQFMLVACRPFVPYTLIVRYVRFAEKNMTLEYRVKEFPKKDGFSSGYICHIYMVSSTAKLNAAGQDTCVHPNFFNRSGAGSKTVFPCFLNMFCHVLSCCLVLVNWVTLVSSKAL